jgi:choice-of-anchor B domain-containing protein
MVECEGEEAGEFQCQDVDMASFLTNTDIGARRGIQVNDVWGWEDPETGKEYAIIGRTDGTSFVDLSDPYNPIYLGDLPLTPTANQALHRDVKVYQHYALVVADGAGAHHMQIFDLHQLRDLGTIPATFEPSALYKELFSSHNLIVNEEAGFAYAVGSDSGGESCGGALHMIDMADPLNPQFAGCFADTRTGRRGSGSTHDAQCVIYHGPDTDYQGQEICLSSNGTAVSIADVTDKKNPVAVSIAEYPSVAYTHQGWLTEDHTYFYLNDEGDETSGLVDRTRTLIFDVTDLDEPVVANEYFAVDSAIDHNLYVKDNLMYQTNYQAGLRILDVSNPAEPVEVGYFDTVPYGENNSSGVLGAWSNYPFFKSGVIVVTSGREGVFFLKKKEIDT